MGVSGLPSGHPGYMNVGRGPLLSDVLRALPADGFVLEILEDVGFDKAVVARCPLPAVTRCERLDTAWRWMTCRKIARFPMPCLARSTS